MPGGPGHEAAGSQLHDAPAGCINGIGLRVLTAFTILRVFSVFSVFRIFKDGRGGRVKIRGGGGRGFQAGRVIPAAEMAISRSPGIKKTAFFHFYLVISNNTFTFVFRSHPFSY